MSCNRLARNALTSLCGAWSFLGAVGCSVPAGAAEAPLRVYASTAFEPCLSPALGAFERETGITTDLVVREPDPPTGADVVVGDDSEMTRILETDLSAGTPLDLGYIPWVFAGSAGLASSDRNTPGEREELLVLGGQAGRQARLMLSGQGLRGHDVSDPALLRAAPSALVPRTLAGPGATRPAALPPLVATASVLAHSTQPENAQRLLRFLQSASGQRTLSACLDATQGFAGQITRASAHAASVVDWWLPACSIERNEYNNPQDALGPPDAARHSGMEPFYSGFMSLGQGGYVTVDLGTLLVDSPGADIRVYQAVSGEPITVYASAEPEGPFALVGLRVPCGRRSPGVYSNHCDFDLAAAGLQEARYLKIEDGEIYPCLAGGTTTEGADLDAVEILRPGEPQ